MSDIFISYTREDQSVAQRIAAALEAEGWTVWSDLKLPGGKPFDDVIESELKKAKCVLVLWSERSTESRYVRDEANYALGENKLIPIAIETVTLPFRFKGIQTIQLYGWNGSKSATEFRRLVDDISLLIGRGEQKTPEAKYPEEAPVEADTSSAAGKHDDELLEKSKSLRRRRWLWALSSIAVLAVLLWIVPFSDVVSWIRVDTKATPPPVVLKIPPGASTEPSIPATKIPATKLASEEKAPPPPPPPTARVSWKASVSNDQCDFRLPIGEATKTDSAEEFRINLRPSVGGSSVAINSTVTLRADSYGMPLGPKDRNNCAFYADMTGVVKVGNESYPATKGSSNACRCDGGVCSPGSSSQSLNFFRRIGPDSVKSHLTLLTNNGTATFTRTNGPRAGESIEMPLGTLAKAIAEAHCPLLPPLDP